MTVVFHSTIPSFYDEELYMERIVNVGVVETTLELFVEELMVPGELFWWSMLVKPKTTEVSSKIESCNVAHITAFRNTWL